jgi:OOP family OmpA-OmpF porin
MRLVAPIAIALMVWAQAALAECTGAFLQAVSIEDCLDPRPSGGARARGFDRNLVVTRKDQPPPAEATVNLWVNFAFDSAELTPDARITLDELGKALRGARLAEKHFVLAGHTDAVGTAEYNQSLSERRANAVRDYLVMYGHVTARLTTEGWGFARPLNVQDARAAENRRVEVRAVP